MKKLGVLFFVVICTSLIHPSSLYAQTLPNTSSGEVVILTEDQVINGDYFVTGDTVEIYGTINGDLYAAGGQMIIAGSVNGDILAAGGQINLTGSVSQDARLMGGLIQVEGEIGRNLTALAGNVSLSQNARIAGNVVITGGNISISAPIGGDVTLVSGITTINSPIQGNISGAVGKLRLASDAQVTGNIIYLSEDDISISQNATVSGTIERNSPPISPSNNQITAVAQEVKSATTSITNLIRLAIILNQIILGLLLLYFFPNSTTRVHEYIDKSLGRTFIHGVVILLVIPIIVSLLFILILSIPIALIALCSFILMIFYAQTLFIYWLGARFLIGLKRAAIRPITLLIGAGLYYLLTSISVVGLVTVLLATILGLGSIVLTIHRTYGSGRKLRIF